MMVSKYYKNRIAMDTLLTAPMGFLHYLYYSAVQESQTDEGKAEHQAEELEEAMEGGIGNEPHRVPRNFTIRSKPETTARPR